MILTNFSMMLTKFLMKNNWEGESYNARNK